MTNNNQKSVSLVPPSIVTPKIDFKGSIYHFALAKHNQYAENKNRPEYIWATTRTIFLMDSITMDY